MLLELFKNGGAPAVRSYLVSLTRSELNTICFILFGATSIKGECTPLHVFDKNDICDRIVSHLEYTYGK